ncbi:hypothetical protein H5410_000956 [Solanum commersonii]|uniref:Uncharacterized protein n=1 Tax=Solanum commersonii TaxID=4109 RepID=A0A9J6AYR4_SOLCO|nr:hypothetical protein H5410_000956 [Solanum commersonii]
MGAYYSTVTVTVLSKDQQLEAPTFIWQSHSEEAINELLEWCRLGRYVWITHTSYLWNLSLVAHD